MISQITGAFVRALLVMVLIATPSLMLPSVTSDTTQIVALVALFAAALTFFEYASTYPGLVEFRDAPPFNRVRFLSLFVTVLLLSTIVRGQTEPTTLTNFIGALGNKLGGVIDVPYSPVRLVVLMLPEDMSLRHLILVRSTAGLSYLISLSTIIVFVITMRILGWPSRMGSFNVWINLPTFDPTTGGDVVERLERDARFNIALGFLLPFLIPAAVKVAAIAFQPVTLESPQTLIWTMTAWAFLPASLLMRGIAMGRIAGMIAEKRRQNNLAAEAELLPA
ncbi:hypothetical protein LX70_03890 [Defluviimonas denitrificans]|uniref:Uncharacterized protein n=1 Tax=Albidovulum denitrificans TaxID=404881 RepID=A0A2S8RYQ0_9RHOB|nr:hypothetical protein [Defluviimonas denitrificans]PQV53705.1 hypothetical protein LX70_03890 [Defluviimonas denitrificans]